MSKITKQGYKLVDQFSGRGIYPLELVHSRDGQGFVVKGGNPPHKPSSTGRVWVSDITNKHDREYFPSVCGLEWREI
tara:strand:- start:143 stop:373 length:231 start_codon:yes stop_codon:yes gene_type:complete